MWLKCGSDPHLIHILSLPWGGDVDQCGSDPLLSTLKGGNVDQMWIWSTSIHIWSLKGTLKCERLNSRSTFEPSNVDGSGSDTHLVHIRSPKKCLQMRKKVFPDPAKPPQILMSCLLFSESLLACNQISIGFGEVQKVFWSLFSLPPATTTSLMGFWEVRRHLNRVLGGPKAP